jgi:hypothetical protein
MNARAEAMDRLGGDFEVRVLEPSPPAVTEPPFADDPVAPGEVPEGRRLVSPVSSHGDLTWDEIASQRESEDTGLSDWCAERWLGAWRRLQPLPDGFAATRAALQRLAEEVVAPARLPENEIALRYTRCGFGTPFFEQDGEDCQVRVQHGELVRQRGDSERREPIEGVQVPAAHALGDFYGFACSVLEELRAEEPDEDPSLVQLWPEHFDIAIELGLESKGRRANYGASPGDDDHPEPYLYVGPWDHERAEGELWNATGFPGAELTYAELLEAPDQRRAALEFMRERLRALGG